MVRKFIISVMFLFIAVNAHAHSLQLGGVNGMVTYPYDTLYDNLPVDIYSQFRIDVLPTVKGEHETVLVLEKSNGTDYIFNLYVSNVDNKLHFKTNSGSGVDIESNSALEIGKKYSVLVTIDTSRAVKMYIDQQVRGQSVVASDLLQTDQATTAVLDTTSPGSMYAGCRSGGSDCLDGTLFETILWNYNPATFPILTLFNGLKVEESIINHWGYIDGVGSEIWSRYQYPAARANGTASGDYSWNLDKYNFEIEEEYQQFFYPANSGTMDINSGVLWENKPVSSDYSWNDMHKVTHCTGTKADNLPEWYYNPDTCENKCSQEWHVAKTGNDTTGNGSLANPWLTLGKMMEAYVSDRPKYRDCFFIHGGTYFEQPGLFYNANNLDNTLNVIKGNEENRVWIGAYGDGRVVLRGDHTDDLVWTTHSGQIVKANYQTDSGKGYLRVSNLILDDNFPDCCEKMASVTDLVKDGDWFVNDFSNGDEVSGTTTATATNKLINSSANFGNETLPVEVGMIAIALKQYGGYATITAIDSPTQLSLSSDIVVSGDNYRINGDTYIYLDEGSNPFTDRDAIITGKVDGNVEFGLSLTQSGHMTVYGIEIWGNESYALNSFGNNSAEDMDFVRVTTKYNKGFNYSGKNINLLQNRSHGDVNSRVGNGMFYASGNQAGWPSSMNNGDNSIMEGNIISWGGGECTGGQYADNRQSRWNFASTCWSVIHYGVDSSKNFTFHNNVGIQHKFMPHYISKRADNEKQRAWHRMIGSGITSGDEEAPRTSHHQYHNNIIIGSRDFVGQFTSCGFGSCHGGEVIRWNGDVHEDLSISEPHGSGWKYETISNNVFIAPNYVGRSVGEEWLGFQVNHQGAVTDSSVGSMFINNFMYFPAGGYNFWWYTDTSVPEPDMHLVDYNYYLSKYPQPFQWRNVKYGFNDWKSTSGYDANAQFAQPNADWTVTGNLMNRTDWDMEGEVTFKFSDFYPVPGSVLINAGHTFDLTGTWSYHDYQFDVRGNRIPIGEATDIGIFSTHPWVRTSVGSGTVSGGSF